MISPASGQPTLDIGDPRRSVYRRAIVGSLVAGMAFLIFAVVTKQVRPLYAHSPWQDDPYDAAVSFSVFFVPLLMALSVLRIPLCHSFEPLPLARVTGLLRASRLILGVVWVTLLAEWMSVATRSNQQSWTAITALLIAMLSVTSLIALLATVHLWRALRQRPWRQDVVYALGSDWLADAVRVVDNHLTLLGPLRRAGAIALQWFERVPLAIVRLHPVAVSAAGSFAFGLVVASLHGIREGGGADTFALFLFVAASAMFGFVVSAGHHLGVVASTNAARGAQRRLIDGSVAGCAAVAIALAFRSWLGWIAGPTYASASAGRLMLFLTVAAGAVFVAVYSGESIARIHATPD